MVGALLLLAQAAATQPADISLTARVEAREATIEASGDNRLVVRASPDAGSSVRSSGTSTSRRWSVEADVRIADPLAERAKERTQETGAPEPR